MHIETNKLIFGLTAAFEARENTSEFSREYAVLTINIQTLERMLVARGVDVAAIFRKLAEKQG